MDKETLSKAVGMVVSLIQAQVREQVDLWRTVPKLALKADGRTGFSDHYHLAYTEGIWLIRSSMSHATSSYMVAIDLSDGQLISPFAYLERAEIKAPHIRDLLKIATHPDEFDAEFVIESLKAHGATPVSRHVHEKNHHWFQNVRPTLNVPSSFGPEERQAALIRKRAQLIASGVQLTT